MKLEDNASAKCGTPRTIQSFGIVYYVVKVKVSVAQFCPALCDPMDFSPPGSSVHGILQARILECVTILFLRVSSPSRVQTHVSRTGRQSPYRCATNEDQL